MSLFKPDTKFEGGLTFVERLGLLGYWVCCLLAGVLIIGFLAFVLVVVNNNYGFIDIPDYITDWLSVFHFSHVLALVSWATGRSFLWLLAGR